MGLFWEREEGMEGKNFDSETFICTFIYKIICDYKTFTVGSVYATK